MARVLTLDEVNEILAECRASGQLAEYRDKSETLTYCPAGLGRGWVRDMQLRSGLRLNVVKNTTNFTTLNKVQQHSLDMPLTFKYYLAGGSRVDNDGLAGEVEEVAGKSYLYHLPKTAEVERDMPGRQSYLCIRAAPTLMCGLCDRIDEFPTPLRATLENPTDSILYHTSSITPAQRQIIEQIFAWPYQGLARHLYLEGKVLELIALHIGQVLSGSPQRSTSVNQKDMERIQAARDILIQNAVSPPLLTDLARQVELSETKLTQGFRQVFNTSVFNYLHHYRLEQARQLLQTGSLNIQEVARSVGYTSFSSFTKAFKKKFKVPPSSYLKSI
ncbi:MAG: helix-turn-helix transcriptional regulator [Symploca sp. SIO2G7]|nr:helix-turn-helix transcriptional regulator [Symploca sp. SIO2G7]